MSIMNKLKRNNVKNAKVRSGSKGRAFTGRDAEFAILKVAYLLSAIDGEVAESEKATFDRLAARCRDVDVDEAKDVIRSAHISVEKLLKARRHRPWPCSCARLRRCAIGRRLSGIRRLYVRPL